MIVPAPASRAPLAQMLAAMPLAFAAYALEDGALVASNPAFHRELGGIAGWEQWERLSDELELPVHSMQGHREVRLASSGRWLLLCWSRSDAHAARLLSAVDVSARYAALDEHRHRHERMLASWQASTVGEMVAAVAHEINQPLAAIMNYLNGCLRLMPGDGPLRPALLAARSQAEHAAGVIAGMREFVQSRSPRLQPVSLARAAAHAVELSSLDLQRSGVRAQLRVDERLPRVQADPVMLEQVLINLLKNALEAMRETPAPRRELVLAATPLDDVQIEVRVMDRGPGVDEADRAWLFAPFHTTKRDGFGLGLSLCRSIVEHHGGRLRHEARSGGGSVFAFTLRAEAT